MELVLGEYVVNNQGEVGTLTVFDGRYITVEYADRPAMYMADAFEKGYICYLNEDLQKELEESIAQAKREAAQKAEEVRMAVPPKPQKSNVPARKNDVTFESIKLMLEPAKYSLNSVARCDKALVGDIFEQCNRDIRELYEMTSPRMTYPKITSHSRSKHCTGFLCRYSDTLVFRVFSRNDVYKNRIKTGVTVMESTTTEILRVIWVNGTAYYFTKNFSHYNGYFYNTVNAVRWIAGGMTQGIMLNDVIRLCDCGYLNNCITETGIDVNCQQYLRLLIPALHSNKAEIVFKNKGFFSALRIDNLVGYLEAFTPKQIDFASKNDVLNTLPIIKQYGISDLDILRDMEPLMKKKHYDGSVYDVLAQRFAILGFDDADLGKKLINFTKKVDFLDAGVYYDYIKDLAQCPGVTPQDFFDKNYIERHNILHRELMERHERQRAEMLARRHPQDENQIKKEKEKEEYEKIAKELSWIDREDNGYFIIVPKTIDAFMDEGMMQNNCVYSNRYYARVIAKQLIIVFLRKEKNASFVTIAFDYDTFEVSQALGKCNRRIDPELRRYVVKLGKQLYYERHTHQ